MQHEVFNDQPGPESASITLCFSALTLHRDDVASAHAQIEELFAKVRQGSWAT